MYQPDHNPWPRDFAWCDIDIPCCAVCGAEDYWIELNEYGCPCCGEYDDYNDYQRCSKCGTVNPDIMHITVTEWISEGRLAIGLNMYHVLERQMMKGIN